MTLYRFLSPCGKRAPVVFRQRRAAIYAQCATRSNAQIGLSHVLVLGYLILLNCERGCQLIGGLGRVSAVVSTRGGSSQG